MGFLEDRRAFWASIAVAGLIVVPLMLNVPLYFDDLGRSLSGSYGWSEDGRPLADAVSQLLLLGAPRTMLNSPLGLLICVPLMALGSCLLARILQHPRFWGHRWLAYSCSGRRISLKICPMASMRRRWFWRCFSTSGLPG